MKVQTKLNNASVIKARIGIEPGGKAHKFFTSTCYRYMGKFVPKGDTSFLNQNVEIDTDCITYKSPYAHYQYIGKLYVDPKYKKGAFYNEDYGYWSRPGITKIPTSKNLKYHTPGTGSYWDKKMWTSRGKDVLEEVQKYIDRGCV